MHFVLSKIFIINDYDKIISEFKSDYILTKRDEFFFEKIKEELKFIIDVINKQKKLTKFSKELYEQKVYVDFKDFTFMGIIDKVMYLEKDNKTYICVVDYKTGNIDTNLKYNQYGLQLQLPIYAYLIRNSNLFENVVISGLYYQKILNKPINISDNYIEEKVKNLKLKGLSTNDESILNLFDSTYYDSDLISGLKVNQNGFSYYSKVFSNSEMNDLMHIVEDKINECMQKIRNEEFTINPKRIGKQNISCKYCKFKDICYVNEGNVINLEEGEKNA